MKKLIVFDRCMFILFILSILCILFGTLLLVITSNPILLIVGLIIFLPAMILTFVVSQLIENKDIRR